MLTSEAVRRQGPGLGSSPTTLGRVLSRSSQKAPCEIVVKTDLEHLPAFRLLASPAPDFYTPDTDNAIPIVAVRSEGVKETAGCSRGTTREREAPVGSEAHDGRRCRPLADGQHTRWPSRPSPASIAPGASEAKCKGYLHDGGRCRPAHGATGAAGPIRWLRGRSDGCRARSSPREQAARCSDFRATFPRTGRARTPH